MVSRWEGGNTKPNIEAAAALAKALGVSLDVLTGLNKGSDPQADQLISLAQKLSKEDLNAVVHIVDGLVAKK